MAEHLLLLRRSRPVWKKKLPSGKFRDPGLLRNQADPQAGSPCLPESRSTGMRKYHIRMAQPFFCIPSALHRSHPDLTAVCDTDARAECSWFRIRISVSLSGAHRRTTRLPGNRFLHIYLSRTERYRIWWNQRIFRPDALPHTDRTGCGTALPSVHGRKF